MCIAHLSSTSTSHLHHISSHHKAFWHMYAHVNHVTHVTYRYLRISPISMVQGSFSWCSCQSARISRIFEVWAFRKLKCPALTLSHTFTSSLFWSMCEWWSCGYLWLCRMQVAPEHGHSWISNLWCGRWGANPDRTCFPSRHCQAANSYTMPHYATLCYTLKFSSAVTSSHKNTLILPRPAALSWLAQGQICSKRIVDVLMTLSCACCAPLLQMFFVKSVLPA